jgi:type IV pilus assembly protein PilM
MISWKLKNQVYLPIGLDIGHHSIKMLQLAVSDSALMVVAAHKIIIEPGICNDQEKYRAFVVSSIRKIMQSRLFHGSDCFSSLPNDKIGITNLRIGQTETQNINEVLKKEAATRFNLDPEIDSINYIYAGSVRHGDEMKNEYILFTTESKTINDHIDLLESAKLCPVGIDPVACALFRSCRRFSRRQRDQQQTEIFVDVGNLFTTVVFGRGPDISFVKNIPIGTEHLDREISLHLGISTKEAEVLRNRIIKKRQIESSEDSDEKAETYTLSGDADFSTESAVVDSVGTVCEKLAKEILLCFRYYTITFRGEKSPRAMFSGGGSYEQTLLNIMKNHMSVEVEVTHPFNGMDLTDADFVNDRRGTHSEWTIAAGLALKGYVPKNYRRQGLGTTEKVS